MNQTTSNLRRTLGIISLLLLVFYPPIMQALARIEIVRDANFYILHLAVG